MGEDNKRKRKEIDAFLPYINIYSYIIYIILHLLFYDIYSIGLRQAGQVFPVILHFT